MPEAKARHIPSNEVEIADDCPSMHKARWSPVYEHKFDQQVWKQVLKAIDKLSLVFLTLASKYAVLENLLCKLHFSDFTSMLFTSFNILLNFFQLCTYQNVMF